MKVIFFVCVFFALVLMAYLGSSSLPLFSVPDVAAFTPGPPTVSITSPSNSELITTSAVNITGTAFHADGISSIRVSIDGGSFSDATNTGTGFSTWLFTATLANGIHTAMVNATNNDGKSVIATIPFTTDQAASLAIGQTDLTTNTFGTSSAKLHKPSSIAFDSSGNMWVADHTNNRVLEYDVPFSTGEDASIAIGQTTLFGHTAGTTSTTLASPQNISFDSLGNLWVSDSGNNRILEYVAPFSTGEAASTVIGQMNFVSNTAYTNSTTLNGPEDISFDSSGNMWVADAGNSRVLEYETPFSTGEAASRVLGQQDFVTSTFNTTSTTLSFPNDVSFDPSGNLWVLDEGNNRVVEYVAPFSTGEAATVVVGEPDFVTSTRDTNSTTLNLPTGISFDPSGNLWVADWGNSRLVKYASPFSTGQAASVVVGEPDFVTRTGGHTSTTLASPEDVSFDSSGNMWVADWDNNRVLEYTTSFQVSAPISSPTVSITSPSNGTTVTTSPITISGTATSTNSIVNVTVSIDNGPFVLANGTTSWSFTKHGLANGNHAVLVKATDGLGNAGFSFGSDNVILTIPSSQTEPAEITFDPANNNLYMVNPALNEVFVMDGNPSSPTFNTVIATISVGTFPLHVVYDSANQALYVDNDDSNDVSVINGTTNTVITTISVDSGPSSIVFDSANDNVYVSNGGSNSISVIDGNPSNIGTYNTVVSTINGVSGSNGAGVAFDPTTGYMYFVNFGSDAVYVINGSANTLATGFTNPISVGSGPFGIAFDPQNGNIYVANANSDSVSVISDTTNTVTDTISGVASPDYIAFAPSKNYMYVTDYYNLNYVSVIDANQSDDNYNTVIHTITVGSSPQGIVYDPAIGDLYVASQYTPSIYVISTPTYFTAAAPSTGFVQNEFASKILGSSDPSTSLSRSLSSSEREAFDSSGNLWVADAENNRIIEYKASLSTDKAASLVLGQPNLSSNDCNNGGISANSLCRPESLAFDSSGNLWVADSSNNRVLEYTAPFSTGEAATVVIGQGNFTQNLSDRGASIGASGLDYPLDLTLDPSGNLWVADAENNRVLKYAAPFSTGEAATVVIGQPNLTSGTWNNGGISANSLGFPQTLSFNGQDLWVGDGSNNRVLKYVAPLSTDQSASVVIGQGDFTHGSTNRGGTVSANTIDSPAYIDFDIHGNLWVADQFNNRVVEYVAPFSTGEAATVALGQASLATNSTNQGNNSPAANTLSAPIALAFDSSGDLWVGDASNSRVLEYTAPFSTNQFASVVLGQPLFTSSIYNNPGLSASTLFEPLDQVFDSHGNLWVADGANNRVLEYTPPFSTNQSASLVLGQSDFSHSLANRGGSPAANTLNIPIALSFDSSGNLWVADGNNSRVLEYTAPFSTGESASLVLGQPDFVHGLANRGGTVESNSLAHITDLFVNSGNLWVADGFNNRILEYTPPFSNGKAASLVIGQSDFIHNSVNQGGPVSANTLSFPASAKIDSSGNLWVADAANNRILKYPSPLSADESATVVLGQTSLNQNATNQGGSPSDSTIFGPNYVRFDSSGNLWVADGGNNRVLEYTAPFSDGQSASSVLGQPDFSHSTANNGGLSAGSLFQPESINFDSSGNIWISDGDNNRILMDTNFVSPTIISTSSISAGSNSFTLGNLTAALTATGIWNNANIFIEQTESNPQTANPIGNVISKFYEIVTNSPNIISSRNVSMNYTSTQITGPPLLNEPSLTISRFNGTWNTLSSTVNTGTKTVTAATPGFSTFALSGFAAPTITSAVGSGSSGFTNGAVITIFFSDPTNRPGGSGVQTKSGVDNIFTISKNLGANYTGRWVNPSTFKITTVDITGNASPDTTGSTTISVNAGAHMRNAAGTSIISTSSATLSGNFGKPPTPTITNFISSNPSNNSTTYTNSNNFTIRFSGSTNQPGGTGVQTKSGVDNIFTFSQVLGATYTGKWINPSTFIVTVSDVTGGVPHIGVTTATVKAGANLKDSTGNSDASTSTSPVLSGSFGIFQVAIPVVGGGTAVTTLPSGIISQTTIGSNTAQTVTYIQTTAPTTPPAGSPSGTALQFLGTPIDISLQAGACGIGTECTFSFEFTCDDVDTANSNLPSSQQITFTNGIPNVSVFHDRQHDGTFGDSGDQLLTNVTQLSPCSFLATAQDDHTSKFAIGGVVSVLALLGASENNAPAPPTLSGIQYLPDEYPLTIDGHGFKLDNYTNDIITSTFQVGKPVKIQLLVYENLGPDDVQGVALFTNLHGSNLQVSDSNTIISYNNGITAITDPDGFFKSANVSTKPIDNKLQVEFDITFANKMDTTNLIIRTWDKENYKQDTQILDAFQVVNSASSSQKENATFSDLATSILVPSVNKNQTPDANLLQDKISIPVWVKNNAAWWADGKINDKNFLVGVQYLVQNGIITTGSENSNMYKTKSQSIPAWVKNDAEWWADGTISNVQFVQAVQYLINNGIISPNGNTSHMGIDPLPFR